MVPLCPVSWASDSSMIVRPVPCFLPPLRPSRYPSLLSHRHKIKIEERQLTGRGCMGSEMAGKGEKGHALDFPRSEQSQTTHEKMVREGHYRKDSQWHKKSNRTP